MAGIYLHIPFCKQACHYCDFHFSTNTGLRGELITAMREEILLQRNFLSAPELSTIYFGGGTPSLLSAEEIALLLKTIAETFAVRADAEITLEANPDDLNGSRTRELKDVGINRLSIGIQSFQDEILRYLNRVHTSETGIASVREARLAGFSNISIDLIYAIPGLSTPAWQKDIATALALETEHVSAYTLTIEEKTTFGNWLAKGRILPVDESLAAEQMEILVSELALHGYRHYEISNFSRPGFESRHNQNYWNGGAYLGIGPSAHSYDGRIRQHNVSNNHLYVRGIKQGIIPADTEALGRSDIANEYIMTSLRTSEGCDLKLLKSNFGYDVIANHAAYLTALEKNGLVILKGDALQLTEAGKLLADRISADLFLTG